MTDKTKNLLIYGGVTLLPLVFFFVLWQMPFAPAGVFNGYDILGLWEMKPFGVLISLTQLFTFFVLLAMLIVGIIGITNTLGLTNCEFKCKKFNLKLLNLILLSVLTGLNFFLLIWIAISPIASFSVGYLFTLLLPAALLTLVIIAYVKENKKNCAEDFNKNKNKTKEVSEETEVSPEE